MLGDFVRGKAVLETFPEDVRRGIELHRHIDQFTDSSPDIANLRRCFPAPFRRYSGIIIDLAYDHELARRPGKFRSGCPIDVGQAGCAAPGSIAKIHALR